MSKTLLSFYIILLSLLSLSGQNDIHYEHGYKMEAYGLEEGIDGPEISDILEDKQGYIWYASLTELIRYDGVIFKSYPLDNDIRLNSRRDYTWKLYEDNDGNIWTTSQMGRDLIKFDPQTEKFQRFSFDTESHPQIVHSHKNQYLIAYEDKLYQGFLSDTFLLKKLDLEALGITSLQNTPIQIEIKLIQDKAGTVWLNYMGNFGKLSYEKDRLTFQPVLDYSVTKDSITWNQVWGIYNGYKDHLWFVNTKVDEKANTIFDIVLTRFHKKTGALEDFKIIFSPGELKTLGIDEYFPVEAVRITEDKYGNIWLGIWGYGIIKVSSPFLNASEKGATNITIFSPIGSIQALFIDSWDNLWIGTQTNHLKKITLRQLPFEFTNLHQYESIQDCKFSNLLEDSKENVWMEFNNENGTKKGLLKYDLKTLQLELFEKYFKSVDFTNKQFTPVMELNNGNILFSESKILHEYNPSLDKIINSSPEFELDRTHLNNHTYFNNGFHYNDSLIVVQLQKRSYLLNRHTWEKKHQFHGHGYPIAITDSKKEGFWFASSYYTNFFKWNGNQMDTIYHPKEIGKNTIMSAFEDSRENIWLTGGTGVFQFAPTDTLGQVYTKREGLPLERFSGMAEDNHQNLWFFTSRGPYYYNPNTQKIENFSDLKEIKTRSTFGGIRENIKNKDGVFRVLGNGGFYSFLPDSLRKDTLTPNILFKNIVLNSSNNTSETIFQIPPNDSTTSYTFPFSQNNISIAYIGIHLHHPKEVTYSYKLEGLSDNWQNVGKERVARFLNLSAGDYTFKIKAANADDVWSKVKKINITILPPWYWSWWSKILYALIASGLIFTFYRFLLNRQLAETEAIRLSELDAVKTKMYTNITHEFRTPLSVILGAAEQLRTNQEAKETIQRNSLNLLNLVNQMLDLSKLEAGNLPLKMQRGDVINYLKYLMESLHSFANSKNIRQHFLAEIAQFEMDFDPDKLMKVITNLLSNAVKFTEEGGDVYMQISIEKESNKVKTQEALQIQIKDTGVGIATENLPHIFDRFYQINDETTREGEGTGIGLAFTQELVKLLGGKVEVNSKIGLGSTFYVWLPVSKEANPLADHKIEHLIKNYVGISSTSESLETTSIRELEKPLTLIVEDNSDVRKYLEQCLKNNYQLVFARNGVEGIEKAIELTPDLIISDVMMPQKDGYELCGTLKKDIRTSHIPIVLLTAKVDIDSRIIGLQRGADAYIAKPFNRQELAVQLDQLLKSKERLKAYYTQTILENPIQPALLKDNLENVFLQKIVNLIEADLQTEWDIDKLCKALAMSRSQIYRKIKALTGYSTTQFIRRIRLKHALKMLTNTERTISEIAYATGFNNLSFFSRSFSKVYGKTPSQFREEL